MTRVLDLDWKVRATLDVSNGQARVLVRLDDEHWYGVTVEEGCARAVVRIGPVEQTIREIPIGSPSQVDVLLSAGAPTVTGGLLRRTGPDVIRLAVVVDGSERELGRVDERYLSTEVAGGFTGRTVGVQALGGQVVLRRFEYRGSRSAELA